MHQFRYVGNRLFCEGVAVESLVKKFGTPLYVYSQGTLADHFQKLDTAMAGVDHLVCFAMKSNSNLSVLRTLANLGSGFDIVSGGELLRVIATGGDARKCVFAGVGKSEAEIALALKHNVYAFNAESEPELQRINRIAARLKKIAPISVRVNPNITAKTHAKITTGTYENKFGIAYEQIAGVYARASKLKNLRLRGIQMHIGSQITETTPFELAVKKMLPLVQQLAKKYDLEFFSIGGGLGIIYKPALASGSPTWWKSSAAKNILTPQRYAGTPATLAQAARPEDPPGTRPLHLGQRRHPRHPGRTRQPYPSQKPCQRGCRHERPHPPRLLRRLSRNRAAHPPRASHHFVRSRRRHLRIRRLFLQRPSAAQVRRRRLSGPAQCRCLWFCDGLQLQYPPHGR